MESKIKTKYPPPFRELQCEIAFLLRHKPTTQPTLVTNVPHISLKSIKPVCNSRKGLWLWQQTSRLNKPYCFTETKEDKKKVQEVQAKKLYWPWFPGMTKHWGPSYCLSSCTSGGNSGLLTAICSSLYHIGGWRAYSNGRKRRFSYVNDDGLGYLYNKRKKRLLV